VTAATPDVDTIEHLDFAVECELPAEYHGKFGDGPAVWIAYIVRTCEHAPQFLLICDGCLRGLLQPNAVVVAPCSGVRFEPASRWILTTCSMRGDR
jgi:hypothetical protein